LQNGHKANMEDLPLRWARVAILALAELDGSATPKPLRSWCVDWRSGSRPDKLRGLQGHSREPSSAS
jgi:hypothetical protein